MKKEVEYFFENVYFEIFEIRNEFEVESFNLTKDSYFRIPTCFITLFSKVIVPIINMLEAIFFCKIEYFKNNTKGKNLFIKAVWTTCLLILVFSLSYKNISISSNNLDPKGYALFIAIFFGLYWNARNVFTRKWDYAANLFNKLCFDLPFKSYKSKTAKLITINYTQSTLAIDLMMLEIWSHKSFHKTFLETLFNAIAYSEFKSEYEKNPSSINICELKRIITKEYSNIFNKKVNKYKKIKDVISTFQSDLSDYVINNDYIF
ncbi:hypothetical protein ABMA79_05985 [Halobacteriovorax sp. HFRX-2_2]|uniref:hypothetical protein n=1 Tax=unclassified Halobacteriovorax TaxID=2639665 RepID=UPI00371814BA